MFEISEKLKRIQRYERLKMERTTPSGVIILDKGEPDFPTAEHIKEAAIRAIRNNLTHYSNTYGDVELREAICFSLKRDYRVERKAEDVLITSGGMEAIYAIAETFLNPGDEAIVIDPGYSAYPISVSLAGAKPVYVPLSETMHLDLESIQKQISEHTKIIFLASPNNPTSTVMTEHEIRQLAQIVIKHKLLLVVDEVYHKLIYDGIRHFSICQIPEISDQAILVNSFSKTYAMTGWRVGYIVAHSRIIDYIVALHRSILICVNTIAQKACIAALIDSQDCVNLMLKEFDKRRKFVQKALTKISRISTNPCEGGFYFFPKYQHKLNSREMTSYLAQKGVLVRSGTEFGSQGQKRIRISFATSMEFLEEGMKRLKKALDELD